MRDGFLSLVDSRFRASFRTMEQSPPPVEQPAGASNRRVRVVAVAFFALAAACVVGTALQGGDGARRISLYLGASEEGEAGKVGKTRIGADTSTGATYIMSSSAVPLP
jgi:hypothetical protein